MTFTENLTTLIPISAPLTAVSVPHLYDMQKEYKERIPFRRRAFILDGEKLHIRATPIFGNHYEGTIPLKEVREEKDIAYLKNDLRMTICGIPGVVAMFLVVFFSGQLLQISDYLFYLLLALSVASVGIGFLFAKKNKFYTYLYSGGNVAFDIGENGNKSSDLDDFIESIDLAIKEARGHIQTR